MSTLLLDAGNSRIKSAWLGAGHTGAAIESRINAGQAAEHDGLDLRAWLDAGAGDADSVWMASVADPAIAAAVEAWARSRTLPFQQVRTQSTALGVRCAYADPGRLGIDRWLVVLAAAANGQNTLIVNAGTACTIDAVTADGQHLGGLILPGVGLARQALNQRTQFHADALEHAADALPVLGQDTIPAVNLGCLHAVLGAIRQVEAGLNWPTDSAQRLLAGGEAPLLGPPLGSAWQHRPQLVLEGLARLAESAQGR